MQENTTNKSAESVFMEVSVCEHTLAVHRMHRIKLCARVRLIRRMTCNKAILLQEVHGNTYSASLIVDAWIAALEEAAVAC